MLGTFDGRKLIDGRFQRTARSDREHDRIGLFQPPFDLGRRRLRDTDGLRTRNRIAGHHLDMLEIRFLANGIRQLETGRDQVVEANLDQPLRNGKLIPDAAPTAGKCSSLRQSHPVFVQQHIIASPRAQRRRAFRVSLIVLPSLYLPRGLDRRLAGERCGLYG